MNVPELMVSPYVCMPLSTHTDRRPRCSLPALSRTAIAFAQRAIKGDFTASTNTSFRETMIFTLSMTE